MEKKKVFNANYIETMGAVIGNDGAGFSREIANILDKRTFNSVNATLAAMAKAGYLTKEKGVFGEKLLTKYSITAEGTEAYNEATAEKVETVETAEVIEDADEEVEIEDEEEDAE